MAMEYRAVEGELGAVNALTNLTTFGAETAGPIKVPANAKGIAEIWVAVGPHVDTAGDNTAITLRLSGKGMKSGQQDFVVYGAGGGVTNTGTVGRPAQILPVELDVNPNEDINVACAAVGDDVLIATVGITLGFEV